jgi:chaperonin GroES
MQIVPLRDRCSIKKDKAEEKTYGGLYIPDIAQKEVQIGTVQAVGPGATSKEGILNPPDVKSGDKVIFPKYCGTDLKEIEKDLFIIPESEILCIIEESTVSLEGKA